MTKQIEEFSKQSKKSSDRLMDYFLVLFFIIGLLLSFYHNTWLIAVCLGGLSLTVYYFFKSTFPGSDMYQYVLAAIMGVFMAQFIYQSHGMFEMHFFAFIGSAILITYKNWKLQIPLAIVVILHHALFAWLQDIGYGNIYFMQMGNMGMETFVIHCLLATAIFTICGLWAHNFKISDEQHIIKSFEMGKLQEAYSQKLTLFEMSEELKSSNEWLKEANTELAKIFNTIEEVLFSVDMVNFRVTQMSTGCIKVYGYTPIEFIVDRDLWKKVIHPDDRHIVDGIDEKLALGKFIVNKYRIIHKDKSIRWIEAKIFPTIDRRGKMLRIDGIHNDITERVALENKLASEKRQKQRQITNAAITAQEKEKFFLGEELHDNINPILATAKLYIDCAISGEHDYKNLLKDSKSFISTAMDEIRQLSHSLIPPSLGEVGLVEAINDLVDNIKKVNSLKFIIQWGDFDESVVGPSLKLSVYRILQEQLSNILKHSNAKTVSIGMEQTGEFLELRIKDDGVGFDPAEKRNGVGLQNIISRTELYHGKVIVNSSPGKGCELLLNFHLETGKYSPKIAIKQCA
jgi:PAS domain S-box-containing protein